MTDRFLVSQVCPVRFIVQTMNSFCSVNIPVCVNEVKCENMKLINDQL